MSIAALGRQVFLQVVGLARRADVLLEAAQQPGVQVLGLGQDRFPKFLPHPGHAEEDGRLALL